MVVYRCVPNHVTEYLSGESNIYDSVFGKVLLEPLVKELMGKKHLKSDNGVNIFGSRAFYVELGWVALV